MLGQGHDVDAQMLIGNNGKTIRVNQSAHTRVVCMGWWLENSSALLHDHDHESSCTAVQVDETWVNPPLI